jgi:hypothetical protein
MNLTESIKSILYGIRRNYHENAFMTETAMQLQKANTTLQALYASSSNILSQSLLDFLT